jgi:starvation-inducible DNA-binding protein
MYTTKNDLPEHVRSKAIVLLNARLADAVDLQTQMKQAHWNVKGPNSIALHELFDKINKDVEDYVDMIAERVVQLGGIALGTARSIVQRSQQREYPLTLAAGREHVEAVSSALAMFGKSVRQAIDTYAPGVAVRESAFFRPPLFSVQRKIRTDGGNISSQLVCDRFGLTLIQARISSARKLWGRALRLRPSDRRGMHRALHQPG